MAGLIVNADDFGHSAGINRGILEAHHDGIVTSTTVMINYPDAPAGLEQAQKEAPDLGLGLHLTLTSGSPVSPPEQVPSLVDETGSFYRIQALVNGDVVWQAEDVEREFRAQLERFQALTGKLPTHLDSHHHVAAISPEVLAIFLKLAAEHQLPVRRGPLADSPEETANRLWFHKDATPEQVLAAAEALHAVAAANPQVRMPDRFVDSFYDHHAILGELLVILTTLPADTVTELMCHPGYTDGLESGYTAPREKELSLLTHSATHEVITAENIQLMSFAALKA